MSANVEPERGGIDGGGNIRQVPAHVKAIIGGEHAPVKDLERSFEQGRAGTLQEHGAFLRKVRDQFTPAIVERQLEERRRHSLPCRRTEQSDQAHPTQAGQKAPPRHG